MCCRDGISACAVTTVDLDTIMVGEMVERPARQARQEFACEPHSAKTLPDEPAARRSRHFMRHELPVERGVVSDEDISLECFHHVFGDMRKRWRVLHHLSLIHI